jgi:glycosyltransferase involved in cell wall biosynthesis
MSKRIKVLFVTDDIRFKSGVGIQAYMLMKGLLRTGDYEIVSIAGSLVQQSSDPIMYEGIRLYPSGGNGYGDSALLKSVIQRERPDITVFFSDPRFFVYAFTIDNEIRPYTKFVFYHTWDNEPFPAYNKVWYSACDRIVMLSRFSYELMKSNGVDVEFAPHGGDPSEFYPLELEEVEEAKKVIFKNMPTQSYNFVIFYNNRNTYRKRTSDIIIAFRRFWKKHPDSVLIMNTGLIEKEGNDLMMVLKQVEPSEAPIIINQQQLSTSDLNKFYNISDVTLNIAYNEGFGLSCMESLLAETPNIAVATGGLTEQMTDGKQEFGILLKPTVRTLFGIVGNPYIYQDYVSLEAIEDALEQAYNLKKEDKWKQRGMAGRDHIIRNYHINKTVETWDKILKDVFVTPSKFERYTVTTI